MAIKEPTFAAFGRHAGSNLLVVGREDESALGVLTNAVIALAAQNPRAWRKRRRNSSFSMARGRNRQQERRVATDCDCAAASR